MKSIINSSKNEIIKLVKKLSSKKYRKKLGFYIIETKKMLDEAIKSNCKIKYFLIREGEVDCYDNSIIIDWKLFNEISSLVTPDGYLAIVEKSESSIISNKVLILDKIQDPGNLGTMIRSAEAFGFNTIMAIDSVDYYNEKVLRASMGSIFRLNLLEIDYNKLLELKDYDIYIADMNGQDFKNIKASEKIAIVIGNEGNGISEKIQKIDHLKIKIPMQGEIESLNAGVSASILMANL